MPGSDRIKLLCTEYELSDTLIVIFRKWNTLFPIGGRVLHCLRALSIVHAGPVRTSVTCFENVWRVALY